MSKVQDPEWGELILDDETWREDQQKEQQRAQIQAAVHNFLRKGRQIEILPPQPDRESRAIRTDRWGGAYEDFSEVLSNLN